MKKNTLLKLFILLFYSSITVKSYNNIINTENKIQNEIQNEILDTKLIEKLIKRNQGEKLLNTFSKENFKSINIYMDGENTTNISIDTKDKERQEHITFLLERIENLRNQLEDFYKNPDLNKKKIENILEIIGIMQQKLKDI